MKALLIALVIFLCLFIYPLLYSQPQQFTWYERNSPVTTRLNAVSGSGFFPPTFWICGDNGVILKTTNDGVSFINQTGNGIPVSVNLISVAIFDINNIVIAGYRNDTTFVYRTTNGGTNWALSFLQPGGYINAVVSRISGYNSSPIGFITGNPVGGRWSLWRTTNSGANWDSTGKYLTRAGTESGFPGSLYYVDSSIWFGTNNSRIYRSSNHGSNWSIQTLTGEQNPSALNFMPYSFSGNYNGDASGSTTYQYTFNSGLNWTNPNITLQGSGRILAIGGHPGGVDYTYLDSWYVRFDNKVYHYPASGGWGAQYTAPNGNFTYLSTALAFYSTSIAAVRDNGGISFCNCQIWGAVRNLGGVIPAEYKLYQNYPNPFNPATTIHFSVPKKTFASINIYNAIGALVETLFKQELAAGNYEITWDAGKYSSGIYYYILEASDASASLSTGFSETKKMVLVK